MDPSSPLNFMYIKEDNKKLTNPKNKFTPVEDMILVEQVTLCGNKGWKSIAEKIPGRNGRQCRERWVNYLSPDVSKRPWSREEDELIKELVLERGMRWKNMKSFFKERTDVMIKNRWAKIKNIRKDKTKTKMRNVKKQVKKTKTIEKDLLFCFNEANNIKDDCFEFAEFAEEEPFSPYDN